MNNFLHRIGSLFGRNKVSGRGRFLTAEESDELKNYMEATGAREDDDELIKELIEDMSYMIVTGDGLPPRDFIFDGFRKIKDLLYEVQEEEGDMDSDLALVTLGNCYRKGEGGMEQDDELAAACFQMGAATDSIGCTQMLGVCYFEGRGIEQDYKSAFMLLCREMEGRNAEIFRCRGLCFLHGWGTEQDEDRAFEEFRVAAENFEEDEADATSMYWLGRCYEQGKGTQPDTKLALKWYADAAERGHKKAAERLQELQ